MSVWHRLNPEIKLILKWRITKQDGGALVLELKPPDSSDFVVLNGLQSKMTNTMNIQERNPKKDPAVEALLYHTHTIELLARLCQGRNQEAIDAFLARKVQKCLID